MNDETYEFEGRTYLNPQAEVDKTNQFIDNLRQIQAADTARIAQDTYALGTQVPSNLGGLSGSGASFVEKYQTPQTEKMIADLRATAQAAATNQALENTLAQYKQRYNDAYRAAKKRAASTGSGGATGNVETEGSEDDYVTADYQEGGAQYPEAGSILSTGVSGGVTTVHIADGTGGIRRYQYITSDIEDAKNRATQQYRSDMNITTGGRGR